MTYSEQTEVEGILVDSVEKVGLLEGHPAGTSSLGGVTAHDVERLAIVVGDRDGVGRANDDLSRSGGSVLAADDRSRSSRSRNDDRSEAHRDDLCEVEEKE